MVTEREAIIAKTINTVVLILLTVLICIAVVSVGIHKYQHTFTSEKWLTDMCDRGKIVNDMLNRYELTGMTVAEVVALLGEEDSQQTTFKRSNREFPAEDTLVYFAGCDFIDDVWLIISIENNQVVEYCFDVT